MYFVHIASIMIIMAKRRRVFPMEEWKNRVFYSVRGTGAGDIAQRAIARSGSEHANLLRRSRSNISGENPSIKGHKDTHIRIYTGYSCILYICAVPKSQQ